MITKREIIEQAFVEAGLSSYMPNLQPDKWARALNQLDRMMARWAGYNIDVGYALTRSSAESDLDQESGLQLYAEEPVALALAIRICPSFGKIASEDLKSSAKEAFDMMITALSSGSIPEVQLSSTMPTGAGNKALPNGQVFYQPEDVLTVGGDELEFTP